MEPYNVANSRKSTTRANVRQQGANQPYYVEIQPQGNVFAPNDYIGNFRYPAEGLPYQGQALLPAPQLQDLQRFGEAPDMFLPNGGEDFFTVPLLHQQHFGEAPNVLLPNGREQLVTVPPLYWQQAFGEAPNVFLSAFETLGNVAPPAGQPWINQQDQPQSHYGQITGQTISTAFQGTAPRYSNLGYATPLVQVMPVGPDRFIAQETRVVRLNQTSTYYLERTPPVVAHTIPEFHTQQRPATRFAGNLELEPPAAPTFPTLGSQYSAPQNRFNFNNTWLPQHGDVYENQPVSSVQRVQELDEERQQIGSQALQRAPEEHATSSVIPIDPRTVSQCDRAGPSRRGRPSQRKKKKHPEIPVDRQPVQGFDTAVPLYHSRSPEIKKEESPEISMDPQPVQGWDTAGHLYYARSPRIKKEESPEIPMDSQPVQGWDTAAPLYHARSPRIKKEESPEIPMDFQPAQGWDTAAPLYHAGSPKIKKEEPDCEENWIDPCTDSSKVKDTLLANSGLIFDKENSLSHDSEVAKVFLCPKTGEILRSTPVPDPAISRATQARLYPFKCERNPHCLKVFKTEEEQQRHNRDAKKKVQKWAKKNADYFAKLVEFQLHFCDNEVEGTMEEMRKMFYPAILETLELKFH